MTKNTNLEPLEVTDENFGDLLTQSAKDALAYVRGDKAKARLRVRTPIAPTIAPPPNHTMPSASTTYASGSGCGRVILLAPSTSATRR